MIPKFLARGQRIFQKFAVPSFQGNIERCNAGLKGLGRLMLCGTKNTNLWDIW